MKLYELAERIGGELEGDGSITIQAVAGLRDATSGDISFLGNPKYAALVVDTQAAAVIVPKDFDREVSCALIRVENPDREFAVVAELFYEAPPAPETGVHPTAVVHATATLGAGVSIGAHCVVEAGVSIGANTVLHPGCIVAYNSSIGADCLLYPLVSVREFSTIGDRVIIHNGTVVGSDGFGYAVLEDGSRRKIPQIGTVVIEDDVEIGANVTIDRARFGKTRIGKGTKIDNLAHFAHNVVVGEHSVMCGQVGISGSTIVGSKVIMAGQSGLAGHLKIGDGAIVGAKSGVMKDIPPGEFVIGSPALPNLQFKKMVANSLLLPKLKEKIRALERKVAQLEVDGGTKL